MKFVKNGVELRSEIEESSVFLATCLAILSSTFFGLSQVPGATGANNGNFEFYWNVPTFMCHRYGMFFDQVPNFGIRQNRKDQFRGDQVAILYDPGAFPALLKDENGRTMRRNGGVPQEGNLTYHLDLFREHVDEQIKDAEFSGLGVIDFESWRPIFRQNWASLAPYRDLSTEIERAKHPFWDKNRVANEATRRFEKAGRLFMEDTLRFARTLRPKASWGYYAYPYCYNLTPNVPTAGCDPKVFEENDRLSWMFNLQDVLLPSVYLRASLSKKERTELIAGRVKETIRISNKSKQSLKKPVLSYFWYKYQDSRDALLDIDDLYDGFKLIKNLGGDGIVLWGSSNDLNTKLKCQEFKDYFENTLGPIAWKLKVGRSSNLETTEATYSSVTTESDERTSLANIEETPIPENNEGNASTRTVDADNEGKMSLVTISTFLTLLAMQFSILRAHREHKVHNIVLYPDKHSWCKTTPIKQVVTWPQCSSQELDNNVCVGACFSYMVPHSEPSAPGDLIRPYCDSCQPLDSIWHTVTLDCKDEDNKPLTMQKQVQIITNCSCSSCTETSKIKPDYNTLLRSSDDEDLDDKGVNLAEDTPDILITPSIDVSNNDTKDTIFGEDKIVQFLRELKDEETLGTSNPKTKELLKKLAVNELNAAKIKEMVQKYKQEKEAEGEVREEEEEVVPKHHEQHHGAKLHIGPHHSLVLDADIKEKIDVEPHHLHPAVAGQEISYHDNVLGDKHKKKDF